MYGNFPNPYQPYGSDIYLPKSNSLYHSNMAHGPPEAVKSNDRYIYNNTTPFRVPMPNVLTYPFGNNSIMQENLSRSSFSSDQKYVWPGSTHSMLAQNCPDYMPHLQQTLCNPTVPVQYSSMANAHPFLCQDNSYPSKFNRKHYPFMGSASEMEMNKGKRIASSNTGIRMPHPSNIKANSQRNTNLPSRADLKIPKQSFLPKPVVRKEKIDSSKPSGFGFWNDEGRKIINGYPEAFPTTVRGGIKQIIKIEDKNNPSGPKKVRILSTIDNTLKICLDVDIETPIISSPLCKVKKLFQFLPKSAVALFETFGKVEYLANVFLNGFGHKFILTEGDAHLSCVFYKMNKAIEINLCPGMDYKVVGQYRPKHHCLQVMSISLCNEEDKTIQKILYAASDREVRKKKVRK